MIAGRRHGGLAIVLSFAAALLLTIVPLADALRPLRPDWVGLTLIYWTLMLPDRVSVGTGWLVGLLLDVLTGSLLGEHAFGLAVVAFLCVRLHQRIRVYPLWQQALTVLMLLALHQLLSLWIERTVGRPAPGWIYWLPSFTGALLWPFVQRFMRGVQRAFSVN